MDFYGRQRRHRYPGLVVLLLVILASAAGAQDSDTAVMEFDPPRVVKGNLVNLRIRTTIPWTGAGNVDIGWPELPRNVAWWGYPKPYSWAETQDDGTVLNMVAVHTVLLVDAPGFFSVGPFIIRSDGRTVDSGIKTVVGLEPDEADLPFPVFTQWRNPPETVWQGEAVPLILEALNFSSLALADSVSMGSAPEGLLEEAPGLGGIVTRSFGNDVIYDVPMASWIWTPGEPGTYSFPFVQLDISGMKRATPGFNVEVLPVPDGVLSSGAVGRFSVGYEIEDGPYHVGDVVSLRVRVEGDGNFNILNPPVPEMVGAELVGQGSSSSFIPGLSGYSGWREERYDYQLERSGRITFTVPGWTWFDPVGEGTLRRSYPENGSIDSEPALNDSMDEDRLLLLGGGMFRYTSSLFHWRNTYWFLLALPGFIFLVVIFLVKRPGTKSLAAALVLPLLLSASNVDGSLAHGAAAASETASGGDWEGAESAYLAIMEETGEFPGLLHDLAIVEMELGHPDLAVAYMRRANRLRPGSSFMKEELRKLEHHLALDDQVPLSVTISPAIIFGILLGSINLVFLMSALLLYRRDARVVILSITVAMLLAASLTGVFTMSLQWDHPAAVVRTESAPLRKIPGPLATDWIQLPAGTAVTIVAQEGVDFLVRTGYGLEGWLPAGSMIQMTGDAGGF